MRQNTYYREQGTWNLLNEASRYYDPCAMARQSRRSGVFCWKTSSGWEVYTIDKYVLIWLDGGVMSNLDSENSWLIKKPQSQLDPGTFEQKTNIAAVRNLWSGFHLSGSTVGGEKNWDRDERCTGLLEECTRSERVVLAFSFLFFNALPLDRSHHLLSI